MRLLVAEGRLGSGRPRSSDVLVTIPQGVREVVGRRLDRLSDECNQVLRLASVIGREFGVDVLEPVACDEAIAESRQVADDLTRERLLEVLDEAVAARVIQSTEPSAAITSRTRSSARRSTRSWA